MRIRFQLGLPGPFVLTSGGRPSGQLAAFITGLVLLGLFFAHAMVATIGLVVLGAVLAVVLLVRRW